MIEQFLPLYENISIVKHNPRQGWIDRGFTMNGVCDTQGTHMFGAGIIAWWYAAVSGLDSGKLSRMLLIHDLVMARMPDLRPGDPRYARKREIENEALDAVILSFPSVMRDDVRALLHEYQEELSPYAIAGRECDKLDTLLQAYQYSKAAGRNEFARFLKNYEGKFVNETGKVLYADLLQLSDELDAQISGQAPRT